MPRKLLQAKTIIDGKIGRWKYDTGKNSLSWDGYHQDDFLKWTLMFKIQSLENGPSHFYKEGFYRNRIGGAFWTCTRSYG